MTSTELRKITFLVFSVLGRDIILQERDVQDSVDEQPCEPVTRACRAGYRHTLEVKYQLSEVAEELYQHNLAGFLPEFRNEGFVAIMLPAPLSDKSPFFSTPS